MGRTIDMTLGDEVPDAVPAATVILLRDGEDGLETLMLRRNSKLAFAGGHWVFPGGRVDADDLEPTPDGVQLRAQKTGAIVMTVGAEVRLRVVELDRGTDRWVLRPIPRDGL